MSKKFQILLIEDNPIDALILKKTFFNLNADCAFTEFDNAEKALKYLENVKNENINPLPDIIISDLVLPKMSGNDLLMALKDDDTFRRIPFVMFTNSASEWDVKMAYSYNVNSYIVKPLSLNIYKETIRSLWDFWASAVRLPHYSTALLSGAA